MLSSFYGVEFGIITSEHSSFSNSSYQQVFSQMPNSWYHKAWVAYEIFPLVWYLTKYVLLFIINSRNVVGNLFKYSSIKLIKDFSFFFFSKLLPKVFIFVLSLKHLEQLSVGEQPVKLTSKGSLYSNSKKLMDRF